jgi:DNA-binding MarR family transcriptional regulator
MFIEQRAKILEITTSKTCGVRDLIQLLKMKTSNITSLLKKMEEEQLISTQFAKKNKKGRPKKRVIPTPLGHEFLETYMKLNLSIIKSRKTDLDHAAKDAKYAERLVETGHSPFQIFLELNTIASNIKNSSENHQNV